MKKIGKVKAAFDSFISNLVRREKTIAALQQEGLTVFEGEVIRPMAANKNSKNHGKPIANDKHSPISDFTELPFPLFRQAGIPSPHDTATDKHFVAMIAVIFAIGIITSGFVVLTPT